MLDAIDIKGRTITADTLLTQRDLAKYLIVERNADYHFGASLKIAFLPDSGVSSVLNSSCSPCTLGFGFLRRSTSSIHGVVRVSVRCFLALE